MFLERNPALRRALFNQYQVILALGSLAVSMLLQNPLPALLLFGGELVAMPALVELVKKRMEDEKRTQARNARTISQEEQYGELGTEARARFARLRRLCLSIQENYRGLSPASQQLLTEQDEKFDAILVSCLRRLWLLKKHQDLTASFDREAVEADIARHEKDLEAQGLSDRFREATEQNLAIKRRLLETVDRNASARGTLATELDSVEALLQLLVQKSLAASDADALAADVDDALAQAEADDASVKEMEQVVGALPSAARGEPLSARLKVEAALPPPGTPPRLPMRDPEGPGPRRR